MKFLIVDDKEVIIDLLSALVGSMGYSYTCAADGLAAYELLCKEQFDIMITDLMMPRMKGEKLIKKVREGDSEIVIIVITGYASIETAIEVMKEGAFDFIKKPFHINEIKLIIKKAVEYHQIREKNRKFSEEMKIAQGLRDKLIYQSAEPIPGMKVGVETIFLEELGGDVYNILPLDDENVFVYIGDVSSRGVSASLLFSMVQTIIREIILVTTSPQEVLTRINQSLTNYLGKDTSNFVTMLVMKLNLVTNLLTYAKAGHNSPIICRGDKLIKNIDSDGVFLGMFQDVIYTEQHLQLQKGDTLVLFTDGMIEARNKEGEMIGLERVEQIICENKHLSYKALAKKIGKEVMAFKGEAPLKDDISILVLGITGEKADEVVPIEEVSTRIINMKISSVLKYRKGIVSRILSLGDEMGMSNNRLQDLRLVVDEAVINAIEHGNNLDRDKQVFVQCRCDEHYLEMRIVDEGEGYNPLEVLEPDVGDLNMRGRGLFLIKQFADEVSFNEKANEIIIGYHLGSKS